MNWTIHFRGQEREIPEHMRQGLTDYIERGVRPGDFLYYVLCNDLGRAVDHADDVNFELVPWYVVWLFNRVPAGCHGSRENVEAWIAHHGKRGLTE